MKFIFFLQTQMLRRYVTIFLLILLPILSLITVWQKGQMQQAVTLSEIILTLTKKGYTLKTKNNAIILSINERGVDFVLTPQIEKELRKLGANNEVIETIRKKSPKTPANTPSQPSPTPSPSPPKDAAFYQKRGDEYFRAGDYDKAIADYNESIRLNPQDAAAYYNRGLTYHYKNDREKASADYKTASQLKPELASQPLLLCLLYDSLKGENPDKAIEDCGKTINSSPTFALAYFIRGNAYANKKDNDHAIVDYNKTIELNPKYAPAYINRGTAFDNKQDYILAIADYNKVIELNPNLSAAYNNRGNSYEQSGNLQQAENDYQKAVELDANNEIAKSNLQRLKAKQAEILSKTQKQETSASPIQPNSTQEADLGDVSSRALDLTKPIYPQNAKRLGIQGKVTVQIKIDEEGNVISAKASSGNGLLRAAAEDAAKRSKFQPAMVGSQPVKARGYITYNFTYP